MQDCDGVVITHGTDTMGYTAAALSYMLLGQMKPVIPTGSQLPLGAPLSDAEINLSCAIEAACQGVAGTYVCFNRKLILGTRAVKTHTLSFDAFRQRQPLPFRHGGQQRRALPASTED